MWTLRENSIQEAIAQTILFNFENDIKNERLLLSSYNKFIIDHLRRMIVCSKNKAFTVKILKSELLTNIELSYILNISQVLSDDSFRVALKSIDLLRWVNKNGTIAAIFYLANEAKSPEDCLPLFMSIKKNWVAFADEEKKYENPFGDNFTTITNGLIERAKDSNVNKKWLYLLSAKAIMGNEGNKHIDNTINEIVQQNIDSSYEHFYKHIIKFINDDK